MTIRYSNPKPSTLFEDVGIQKASVTAGGASGLTNPVWRLGFRVWGFRV